MDESKQNTLTMTKAEQLKVAFKMIIDENTVYTENILVCEKDELVELLLKEVSIRTPLK